MRSTTSKLLATLALLLLSGVALAQAWPPASVRIIVPYPPGGATDVMARTVAQKQPLNCEGALRPGRPGDRALYIGRVRGFPQGGSAEVGGGGEEFRRQGRVGRLL